MFLFSQGQKRAGVGNDDMSSNVSLLSPSHTNSIMEESSANLDIIYVSTIYPLPIIS